jgi:biotin carboxylase
VAAPTLLVIAAGPLQVPAIVCAREMGIRTVAVDGNPKAVGLTMADAAYVVDIRSHDAVEEVARKEKADGIMTLCTDNPVRLVASVGAALGLPVLSTQAAYSATDKRAMRSAFAAVGAPSVRYAEVGDLDVALAAAESIGYPVAVKAPRSSGSRGVCRAVDADQLRVGFLEARLYETENILIEEWIDGPELSIEGICCDGTVHIVQLTDKCVFAGAFPVEAGHTQPSRLPADAQQQIRDATTAGIRAIGLNDCAFHAEVKFSALGGRLIEIGARLGGDRISTHLTPLSTGVDLVRASIDVALGRKPDLSLRWNRGAAVRYFQAPQCGCVHAIEGLDEILRMPGLELLFAESERDGPLRQGFDIKPIHSSLDRYGHVIFSGADAEQAAQRAEAAARTVRFVFTMEQVRLARNPDESPRAGSR